MGSVSHAGDAREVGYISVRFYLKRCPFDANRVSVKCTWAAVRHDIPSLNKRCRFQTSVSRAMTDPSRIGLQEFDTGICQELDQYSWKGRSGDNESQKQFNTHLLEYCVCDGDTDSGTETRFKYRIHGKDISKIVQNWRKKYSDLAGDCPRPE